MKVIINPPCQDLQLKGEGFSQHSWAQKGKEIQGILPQHRKRKELQGINPGNHWLHFPPSSVTRDKVQLLGLEVQKFKFLSWKNQSSLWGFLSHQTPPPSNWKCWNSQINSSHDHSCLFFVAVSSWWSFSEGFSNFLWLPGHDLGLEMKIPAKVSAQSEGRMIPALDLHPWICREHQMGEKSRRRKARRTKSRQEWKKQNIQINPKENSPEIIPSSWNY